MGILEGSRMLVSPPIYISSNGDCWRLVTDEASHRVLVRHEANAASGGRVTDMDASAFLQMGGSGPEFVAVRAALEQAGDGRQHGGGAGVRLCDRALSPG